MMILSSPASSTRENAGNEAVKVLKTHLPKVINELLCEPTVDDVLDHMHRDLREIGVEDFGVFRFTFEGLPLEKWLLGARVEKGKLARHVYKGELQASPVFRHCNEALEPFFWYDTPHEPYDDRGLRGLGRMVFLRRSSFPFQARRVRLEWAGLAVPRTTAPSCSSIASPFRSSAW